MRTAKVGPDFRLWNYMKITIHSDNEAIVNVQSATIEFVCNDVNATRVVIGRP